MSDSLRLTQRRRACRAVYLFSPSDTTSAFPGDCNDAEPVPSSLPELQLEDTACTAASVIYHQLVDTSTCMNVVSIWAKHWGDAMDGDTTGSPSPYTWASESWNSNLPQVLLARVNDILQEYDGACRKFHLLFLLPTLAYCSSHPQIAFLSMLLAFAREGQHQMGNRADYNLLDGYFTHGVVLKLKEISRVLLEALPASSPCAFQHLQFMLFSESSGTPRMSHTTFTPWQSLSASHHHFLHPSLALQYTRQHSWCPITLDQLLSTRDVPELPQPTNLPQYNSDGDKYSSAGTPTFNRLLSSLRTTDGGPRFQDRYIARLHSSARHVHEEHRVTRRTLIKYPIEELRKHFVACRRKWVDASGRLKDSLSAMTANPLEQTLVRCGQWPPITPYSLLGCLASTSPIKLSENWKTCLVQFALLLLEFQRARRLLQLALAGLEEEFSKELENEGCEGWDAEQYPDWLLVQVRSRSLIVHI